MPPSLLRCLALALLLSPLPASAAQQSFSDVPESHPAHQAAEFLKSVGIVSGYADGTFQPNRTVNRAEAITMLLRPLLTQNDIDTLNAAESPFSDIAFDAWYKPFAEAARRATVIQGPPERTAFEGERPVIKAEFMKIVQLAYGAKPSEALSEISLPLARDVTDTGAWYYPYLRYGIAASMTMVTAEGTLNPDKKLTRGETALLLFRFLMYEQGRRTQALLSEAESELQVIISMLDQGALSEAEYASARALVAARGAHLSKPDEPIVKGAVKIAESFRKLVEAYKAGAEKRFDDAVARAGDAWHLAERGKEFSSSLATVSEQVQTIAKQMADSSRSLKAQAETGGGG